MIRYSAICSLFVFALLFGCTNCIDVTCNGVTTCRDPANIPPCAPIPPSGNGTEAVNLAQELNNSAKAGFNLDESMFYASSASECSKKLITACDNNVPNQYICVNQKYAGTVSSQYSSIYPARGICPMFFMAGNISCGLDDNHCVVFVQGPN